MIVQPSAPLEYPQNPGVYRMLDVDNKIIYIGKAKNLRNRLKSYFDKSAKSTKTTKMVGHIKSIEITVTATETDALVLEQQLINKIKPHYNIIFRDDKSYPFISLSKHKYPKIHIVREKDKTFSNENFFGPYPRREDAVSNMVFIQKHFKIRTCTDNEFAHRSRPCMLNQIGKCSAPCVNQSAEQTENYKKNIVNAKNILKGDVQPIIKSLTKEMQKASTELNFELAGSIRDSINSLTDLTKRQTIYAPSTGNTLVFNIYEKKYVGYAEIISGVPRKIYHQEIPKSLVRESVEDILHSYIDREMLRYERQKLVLPFAIDNIFYQEIDTHTEQQKSWLKLVYQNLELVSGEQERKDTKVGATDLLMRDIFVPEIKKIDCIDISHFSGEATYGGKVSWSSGNMDKSNYRLAKFDGSVIDDVMHIKKTVEKIYHEELPDLLIIDGDKPQMQAAYEGLGGRDVVLICSSKGAARVKGEENFYVHPSSMQYLNSAHLLGDEIILSKNSPVRQLFQNLQDKAHDFANKARKQQMDKNRFGKNN